MHGHRMWRTMLWIRVLGSLDAETNETPIALGGPRQRALLALLVVARGQVVSVDRLIEDLWGGEPPAQALKTLQSYISNLRKLLEAGRAPRAHPKLLVSAPPGYALRLPEDALDASRFERLLGEARAAMAEAPAPARSLLDEALALWRGPAFAEVADEPWAAAEVGRLEELRLTARELRAAAALRTGGVVEARLEAERLAAEQPLREEGWRLFALSLWSEARQADALAALRRARSVLAADLGLDPGPGLAALEDAILNQRGAVLDEATRGPAIPAAPVTWARPAPDLPSPAALPWAPATADTFVGREGELAQLTATAAEVATHGLRIALVTGEAGMGKSTLLSQLGTQLERDGWLVTAGRCPESEGTPPAWAWSEALHTVAALAPPPPEATAILAPLLSDTNTETGTTDPAAGRFRLHRTVWSWLGETARSRPLAIILDDLHWADAETLAVLTAAADDPAARPILVAAAFRPDEVDAPLADALALLARQAPLRLSLPGLTEPAAARLVDAVSETAVTSATVAALTERTGGNPFYLRESARLLRSEGTLVAVSDVPEGVRDVLRRRLARLPPSAVAVLRLAAVAGQSTNVEVLIDAAETDEAAVLDALDAGIISGLLTEPAPGQVRFVHALVRDTVATDLSQVRRTRMHARLADALERLHPQDVSALAYHRGRAATAATAARTVRYCVQAAELAGARYAHDTAVELLTQAMECFDRIPPAEHSDQDRERIELLGTLLRAQVRAGAVPAARATRSAAVAVAERARREDLLIAAFTVWTEPTLWQTRPFGVVDERLVSHLTRLLDRPVLPPAVRCRLLIIYVEEVSGENSRGSLGAALEADTLARELDDPRLRALTAASLIRELMDGDQDQVTRYSEELIELGSAHHLPAFHWAGLFNLARVAARRHHVTDARRLVTESLELAHAYRLPEALAVSQCALAAFAHLESRLDDAERHYAEAVDTMRRQASLHLGSMTLQAKASVLATRGRLAELALDTDQLAQARDPMSVDILGAALAAAGRHDEARAVLADSVPLSHPLLFPLFSSFRAQAVIALDDREAADALYTSLLPHRDSPPAGIANLAVVMPPAAHTLGELAVLLGRHERAAEHFTRAITIADHWNSPHWAARSRTALAAMRDVVIT
ncbi:BTAD domain-containing putative transcriptional regulator [Streptomyces sp. NPDC058420]|uniref:BTAD domain-containing putative transcriptional regulator n=1 Tax=Streptomyces sp. NPDC058420 TaxID=3346489 RepID=UPI0036623F26